MPWGCTQTWTKQNPPSSATYVNWLADMSGNCAGSLRHHRERVQQIEAYAPRATSSKMVLANAKIDMPCTVVNMLFTPLVDDLPGLVPIMAETQRRHDRLIELYLAYHANASAPLVLHDRDRQLSFACLRERLLRLLPDAIAADRLQDHRSAST